MALPIAWLDALRESLNLIFGEGDAMDVLAFKRKQPPIIVFLQHLVCVCACGRKLQGLNHLHIRRVQAGSESRHRQHMHLGAAGAERQGSAHDRNLLPAPSLDDGRNAALLANLVVQHVQIKLLTRHDRIPGHPACRQEWVGGWGERPRSWVRAHGFACLRVPHEVVSPRAWLAHRLSDRPFTKHSRQKHARGSGI